MEMYNQAPLLLRRGEKQTNKNDLFAMRPHNLEAAICCCLGNRDIVALKVMLFFTGNSNEGEFRVSQKVIFDRMNISEKPYYTARKKLEEMKWIEYVRSENAIYINYDNIYADYKNYLKEKKGGCNDSLLASGSNDRPVLTEKPQQSLNNGVGGCNDSQQDFLKDRHNNISNNISNSKMNKISGGACAASAAPPQFFIDIVNDFNSGNIQRKEALSKIDEWYYKELSYLDRNGDDFNDKKNYIETVGTYYFNLFKNADDKIDI